MRVVYVFDDKMGGIASLNANLIDHPTSKDEFQEVILIDKQDSAYAPTLRNFNGDKQTLFTCSTKENGYSVIRRLHKLLPSGPGALILNDGLEMQMLDHYETSLTTYQIVHDEYNYGLAISYSHVVDVFIAHSKHYYEALTAALPERKSIIFYLPHGVSIPDFKRQPRVPITGLRLLFLGRMTRAKGIFDLPVICDKLEELKVPYTFSCIGQGGELSTLREFWKENDKIAFYSPATTREVLSLCAEHDVFVFPTRFEGTPVSLLETMSTGLVPVITDLEGGIQEIVSDNIGFRIPLGQTQQFANAIRKLYEDPKLLNQLSDQCARHVASYFDVKKTSAAYHQLFIDHTLYYNRKQRKRKKIGFRLDQPFIPSFITKYLRSLKA